MVDTSRTPHMGFEPQQPRSTLEMINNFMDHMAQGLEEAKVELTKAKDEYVMYYNCKGNLTILRRLLHLDLAKGNPK
jgi:hypothetical protein